MLYRVIGFVCPYISLSERQIVCTAFALCLRLFCKRCGSRSRLCGGERCSTGGGLGLRLSLCGTVYGPCVDTVEPPALVFTRVNIERYSQLFTCLYVELLDTILAEYSETALARELIMSLQNIFLRHPRIARACRYAAVCRKHSDDFTCYFHFLFLLYNVDLPFSDCEITKNSSNLSIFQ